MSWQRASPDSSEPHTVSKRVSQGRRETAKPIIYTGPAFWTEHGDDSFGSYPLWIARFAQQPGERARRFRTLTPRQSRKVGDAFPRIMPGRRGGNVYSVREGVKRWHAQRQSRQIDISEIRVVCLALGPYRNLSTLTGSILFLHPHCQVLNHGGVRIFGDSHVDFISEYSPQRFDAFVRYAVQISGGGRRGKYGGSILHSHAFDASYPMAGVYAESHGSISRKKHIHALFWKEPLPTANRSLSSLARTSSISKP